MKINKKALTAVIAIVGVAVGASSVIFAESQTQTQTKPILYSDPNHKKGVDFASPDYKINENGESYGSISGVSYDEWSDLISVEGDNGVFGYMRKSEFLRDEEPSSPEEALRLQEERIKNGDVSRVINVYDSDGVTVIDTFTTGTTGG